MSDIGVVHMDLDAKGGGESVCMNVLEALGDDHDLTLLTLTEPDFEALDEYFDTDVGSVPVRRAGTAAPALHRTCGLRYYVLQNALLARFARRHADEYDLLFSTINELGLPDGSVEYVHFPFDWSVGLDATDRDRIFHPTMEESGPYERLCTAVAAIEPDDVRTNRLLANSEWTATAVENAYGVRPEVLYPPVDTSGFVDRPWDERESGFVTIGRIERSKRICELVAIIDDVRERGHDVHLHVVGPPTDDDYRAEVASMAADRPHVHLEGELPRSDLVDLVSRHRYGIHGKEYEHFGMAVAELAAGGTVPFVPAGGGQGVIVADPDRQQYASRRDAAEKVTAVLDSPALQRSLRGDPATIRRRFGRRRFQEQVRILVDEALQRGRDPVPAV